MALPAQVHREVLARERTLPVVEALRPLFPDGGLRRGSVVAAGSTTLALTVAAGPSAAGSWCAAVGLPWLGPVAARQAGVALERFALVPDPGDRWAEVAAALIDAIDVVILRPSGRVRTGDVRRLQARCRERGAVLVVTGAGWEGADLRLDVVREEWTGIGRGWGCLLHRRIEVVATGRGAAARERRASLGA